MLIGIISDTHDNWPTLDRVCAYLADEGIETLIHCGDMCAPLTLGHLLDRFGGEIHTVLGNVDGDPFLMATRFARDNLHQHGAERAELELGGRRIAMQHYPALARALAATGSYDAVFYGHDHTVNAERLQVGERSVLLANPGALAAMGKAQTFYIYDTESNEVSARSVAHQVEVVVEQG
jgi:putative phosphoesterase